MKYICYNRNSGFQQEEPWFPKTGITVSSGWNTGVIPAGLFTDHVHMLVEIPPKTSVSTFMGYLKGKSATMIYEQFGELKYRYRNREFWCKGYYVDTVGKNESRIAEYIKHQLEEDKLGEQLSFAEANHLVQKK